MVETFESGWMSRREGCDPGPGCTSFGLKQTDEVDALAAHVGDLGHQGLRELPLVADLPGLHGGRLVGEAVAERRAGWPR